MAPNHIYLIRHAQGFHNLGNGGYDIPDPLLTPAGKQQCIQLSESFENIQAIDCIVASPMRRTLYTALITFREVLKQNPTLKVIALPELQETSGLPCDVGLSREELQLEFKDYPIDFTLVRDGWNDKASGIFTPFTDMISYRADKARKFLQCRTEKEIAVVTHGGTAHYITGDWEDSLGGSGKCC